MPYANFTSTETTATHENGLVAMHVFSRSSRAGLLLHLERYQEALVELEELRQIAPKESLVYYLLSKVSDANSETMNRSSRRSDLFQVHRHLKNFHYSYMYMSWSMDLDPKGRHNRWASSSFDERTYDSLLQVLTIN